MIRRTILATLFVGGTKYNTVPGLSKTVSLGPPIELNEYDLNTRNTYEHPGHAKHAEHSQTPKTHTGGQARCQRTLSVLSQDLISASSGYALFKIQSIGH